eukprot:scaffold124874_cov31-Tisochrysis_lutea.AAC.1
MAPQYATVIQHLTNPTPTHHPDTDTKETSHLAAQEEGESRTALGAGAARSTPSPPQPEPLSRARGETPQGGLNGKEGLWAWLQEGVPKLRVRREL